MATFMEFLGHREYGGATFLNALLPKTIAALIHEPKTNASRVVDNEADYLKFVDAYNGRAQVYIGMNPVRNDLKRHSKDEDVTHLTNIYIDLDLEKPEEIEGDVAAGYPDKAKDYAAPEGDLERLEPHIAAVCMWLEENGFKSGYHDHTGNGHRWILPIPAIDLKGYTKEGRDNLQAKIKAFLKRGADECGIVPGCGAYIDHTTDFRRLTGVPGTLNLKLETETRKNRIREPFRGAERDEDVALCQYIIDTEITQLEPHSTTQQGAKQQGGDMVGGALEYRMARDPKLKSLYEGDISGYLSRSEAEIALANKLVFYNFRASEIEDILLSAGIGKARDEKRKGHTTYIKSTLKSAFEFVSERVTTPGTPQVESGVSPDDFLVGDRKVFDANLFSKWLINESGYTFVTLSDTEEVLYYDNGAYQDGGSGAIREIAERVMDGAKVTKHTVNEIVGHIQRRTYVERDDFDKDKRIINLQNGLFDTRTGELKPHTPTYLSTVRIPVVYDPVAVCPAIDTFLSEVLDAEDIKTAHEWFGYVLEPDYWIQSILMLLGEGGNGKSTFLSLMSEFIGKRNISNESIHSLTNNRFRAARLHGKLANIYADISDKGLKETGILKLLSGGDYVSAEKKNKAPFDFKNFARLIFSANRLPRAGDDTDAWYRRWTFINFTRKFGNDPDAFKPDDKKLLGKLATDTELSGLLNRALEALRGLHAHGGFSRNLSTEETRRIYKRLSDPVQVFIEDCCMIDPKAMVKRSVLFNAYIEFCHTNRQASIGQAAFTKRIRDMGKFSECQAGGRDDRERGWRGLDIDSEARLLSRDTLCDTLCDSMKPHTSGAGDTHDTLEKPSLANYEQKHSRETIKGGEGRKSVSSVSRAPSDTVFSSGESVSPSVSPSQICGKCGCELIGQTFQGPAGLGRICAECQAELDRTSGHDEQIDTDRDTQIAEAVTKLMRESANHEFTVTGVLIKKLPKKARFSTVEIERFMVEHADSLKIERMGGGKWRQVST